jgi:hypothetical protein
LVTAWQKSGPMRAFPAHCLGPSVIPKSAVRRRGAAPRGLDRDADMGWPRGLLFESACGTTCYDRTVIDFGGRAPAKCPFTVADAPAWAAT